ncbi:hypothetical protein LMG16407_03178 [Pandoraea apista]|nr:hypothetical protein LMG16407_03178 [Pandoraea apista]
MVTPSPSASICAIENKPFPALARRMPRSLSVTLFIAANCIEFAPPNTASCTNPSHIGQPGPKSAKLAIEPPTIAVLTIRKRV